MPAKNPRIHVVLETPLFNDLRGLARKNGVSLSLEARELIREALKSSGSKMARIYQGKYFGALIGKFRLGRLDADEALAGQAHG